MISSKILKLIILFCALAASVCTSASAAELLVTTGADSGDGSLRAALAEAAKNEGNAQIFIVTGDDIEIESPLVYEGAAPLGLYGSGQVIKANENFTLLTVAMGADLFVSELSFQGPGGFSIEKRDQGKAGKGIFVDVAKDATGTVHVELDKVSISGMAYYGVHISDCNLADDCGFGMGGMGGGSDASIALHLTDVEVSDVGHGRFDADGVRVDERGKGDIRFTARRVRFTDVGADGVELDEGQAGSVIVHASDAVFSDNGTYCDPVLLKSFLPEKAEAKYKDGEMAEAGVPANVTGSPDDACFEREVKLYGTGSVKEYEIALDLDDGFDIDEAGDGDLIAVLADVEVKGNRDEGIDFDEAGAGKISVSIRDGEVEGQTDDGVKISENGAGGLTALLHEMSSKKNGGKGISLKQADEGDISITAVKVETADNDDGDKTGIKVVQDGDGRAMLTVRNSDIEDGISAEGIELTEE